MEDAAAVYSKMKVADLKKELKNRGLAVTGNKNELVERLLAAEGHEPLGSVEGEEEEFDEEEILGGDMDSAQITPQEEEAALAGANVKAKKAAAAEKTPAKKEVAKTPAKKAAAPAATEAKSPTKKPISAVTAGQENEPPKKVAKAENGEAGEEKSDMEKRAERFGLPLTEQAKKEARAARFGGELTNGTVKANKLTPFSGPVDIDVLKKRAERFGEITSKSLTKAEELEKKKSRQERFGDATTGPKDEAVETAKAARAARFGTEAKATEAKETEAKAPEAKAEV